MSKKELEGALGGEESQEQVTISKEEFEQLKSGKSELSQLVEGLANAIIESKKPYVSPGQEANDAASRASMKKQAEFIRRSKKWEQDACPHIMACNPLSSTRDMFNRSSFIQHTLDTGARFLMCTNCQKVVWYDDPEFVKYANHNTTNQPSAAGHRYFHNQEEVMKAGR
jgi:hypothetical protein